jgi:hypothetical protein
MADPFPGPAVRQHLSGPVRFRFPASRTLGVTGRSYQIRHPSKRPSIRLKLGWTGADSRRPSRPRAPVLRYFFESGSWCRLRLRP